LREQSGRKEWQTTRRRGKDELYTECKRDAYAARAIGSSGRKLLGAARKNFMKKCKNERLTCARSTLKFGYWPANF
jgi:hypothetical protein